MNVLLAAAAVPLQWRMVGIPAAETAATWNLGTTKHVRERWMAEFTGTEKRLALLDRSESIRPGVWNCPDFPSFRRIR